MLKFQACIVIDFQSLLFPITIISNLSVKSFAANIWKEHKKALGRLQTHDKKIITKKIVWYK